MRLLLFLLILCAGLPVPGQAGVCIQFGPFKQVGNISKTLVPQGTLHEVSGLEASRMNPGVLWAHDDAGNGNQIVAITTAGKVVQQYQVGTLVNGDWEDIAIGPGPDKGRDYIYLANIGNNNLLFTVFSLIRFPEPMTPNAPGNPIAIKNPEIFAFRYPNNRTHDAETLMIDPVDGTPYILTKEKKSTTAFLYSYPLPLEATKTKTLKFEKSFFHPAPKFSAGDVSSDGRWVIVRNDDTFYTYLRGAPTSKFANAFANIFCTFSATNQGNAESLTISADGTHIYCTAELSGAPIWESVGKLPPTTVAMPAWWNYGSAWRSWLWGTAGLTLDTFPAVGRKVSIALWSAKPSAQAAIGISLTAIPDGQFRIGGGWGHVLPVLVILLPTTKNGTAEVPLGTVPNTASVLGVQLHAQAAISDIAASFGLALTRGLTLQVGR